MVFVPSNHDQMVILATDLDPLSSEFPVLYSEDFNYRIILKNKQNSPFCQLRSLHRDLENFLTAAFLFKLHSASEIELAEISLRESVLLERPAPTAPRQTWLTVLKRELEFLGVSETPLASTRVETGSKKEYLVAST